MCHLCREQETKLRDLPATERELAKIRRYRLAGIAPAMPTWYQAHVRALYAAPWRAGLMVNPVGQLAAERMRIQNAPQVFKFPSPAVTSTAEYAKQFVQFNGLT